MSLQEWQLNDWLMPHKISVQEIMDLYSYQSK